MSYKNLVCMNIAVIGDGRAAETIARDLAIAEHNVMIGVKDEYCAIDGNLLADFDNILLTSIEHAALLADAIILATPSSEIREAAYLLDDVRSKVIIDMSAFENDHSEGSFLTTNAVKSITFSQHVVKCFSKDYYNKTINPLTLTRPDEMYVVGDSRKAKELVKLLSRDMGINHCFDIGSSENADLLDEMAKREHEQVPVMQQKVPVRR